MIKVIRAKLHGIKVTNAHLDYHGSITLDPEHCELAGIYPLEFVEIEQEFRRADQYLRHLRRGWISLLHPEWGGSPNLSDRRPTNHCGIRIHRPSDALRFRPNGTDFPS
jgi:Aspartate decarboxylase